MCMSALNTISEKNGFLVWAYCFMPDHLHLLIEGTRKSSDLKRSISEFKQSTGYSFKRKNGKKLWQESYYDHVLRDKESAKKAAEYILMNPVRKGLANNCNDYPFSGSFKLDMDNLVL